MQEQNTDSSSNSLSTRGSTKAQPEYRLVPTARQDEGNDITEVAEAPQPGFVTLTRSPGGTYVATVNAEEMKRDRLRELFRRSLSE